MAKTAGSVSHTFGSGDLLCMSIRADGTAGANDIHLRTDDASTSGTPTGVSSRLEGPFTQ